MWKLLVVLVVIKLYAQIDMFKSLFKVKSLTKYLNEQLCVFLKTLKIDFYDFFTWYLTVPSTLFILNIKQTLGNCFHVCSHPFFLWYCHYLTGTFCQGRCICFTLLLIEESTCSPGSLNGPACYTEPVVVILI